MKLIQRIYRLLLNLRRRTYRLLSVITVCLPAVFGLNLSVFADVAYVDGSLAACDNDGDSWGAAFKYLQDALDFAADPQNNVTQIWVRATVPSNPYRPDQDCANPNGSRDREKTFQLVKGVFLLGGFDGTETLPEQRDPLNNITILSGMVDDGPPSEECDGGPANECGSGGSCFQIHGTPGCDNADCCRLVCDPYLGDPYCCCVEWDQHCVGIALDLCGEAYHVVTAGSEIDDPEQTVIDGFTIRDGWANGSPNLDQHLGGGMFIEGEPSVVRCTFRQNTAWDRGGGMSIRGLQPWIINCTFENNPGDPANPGDERLIPKNGGGLANALQVGPILTNCLFAGNAATVHGGGIFTEEGNCLEEVCGEITLINCTLVSNTADADNSGSGLGGGLYAGGTGSIVTVDNSIFWGNSPDQINEGGATVFYINYSDCEDDCPGIGGDNINVDPLFVDAANGDYRLTILSLCIDAGNPLESIIPCDFFNLDIDGFSCAPNPSEPTPDLDLFNRVLDGKNNGEAIVDMGSYEFIHPNICPWDLDGNCDVGIGDLLIVLADWGNPYGIGDLLALLAAWGPCPPCSVEPLSLAEELADACLTQENWDDFVSVMQTGSEAEKENWMCWMTHYLFHCNKCTCEHLPSECPGPDPFSST